jgi:AAA domain, putative AbiEii toxin, Type IV TA system/AAA domain
MQQLSLDLQNFRKFESLHLDFHPRFTLLMGVNGTGKTTALRGVYMSWITAVDPSSMLVPQLNHLDVRKAPSLDIAANTWLEARFPVQALGDFQFADRVFSGQGQKKADSGGHPWFGDRHGKDSLTLQLTAAFHSESVEPISLFARFGASKPTPAKEAGALVKPFSERKDVWKLLVSDEANSNTLTSWFQYYELRSLQEKETPLSLTLARKAVLQAIHAEEISFVIRENALMVRHADIGWRKFSDLSDGQQRIAAIFCDLAMRCASLNSHLGERAIEETPGIVTIDELDLHLHPQWQRTVIQDLLAVFPKLQFIATSHSPFLLQGAFAQGAVIDMGTGQTVEPPDPSIEDIAEQVMGVEMPQRGKRWHDMKDAATEYYKLLEVAKQSTDDALVQAAKARLDALIVPYTNDPAYAAWLEMHRAAAGV